MVCWFERFNYHPLLGKRSGIRDNSLDRRRPKVSLEVYLSSLKSKLDRDRNDASPPLEKG